ncbi:MAG: 6-phosphogluconolactonase [Nitrospirae bacterium]|jgi:6-phosphogluconolactonase|nr:6-phosphogluconolactonase [Nitrospirota bacterium]
MVSRTEEHLNPVLPRLRVFPDEATLAREGAAVFVESIREKIMSQGHASVILAGGGSPRLLYEEAGKRFSEWPKPLREKLFFVPGDERMVRPDDPRSNSRMIHETLLARGGFPETAFERMRGETASPEGEALRYERALLDRFKTTGLHVPAFDWAFLGVGEDGHTASLFPGSDPSGEHRHLVLPVPPEGDRLGRITLGYRLLAHAQHLIFIAPGTRKKGILREILVDMKNCPVQELLTLSLENGHYPEFWIDRDAEDPSFSRLMIGTPVPADSGGSSR